MEAGRNVNEAEALRLAALMRYGLKDTASDPDFDRLARLAAALCNAPIASIGLIDDRQVWFKARFGHGIPAMTRGVAISSMLLEGVAPLIVRDLAADPRFGEFLAARTQPAVRFYAGAPLITSDGARIGAIAVLDWVARPDVPETIAGHLAELAALAVGLLERGREQQRQAEQAEELSLINDILTRLTSSTSLTDAIGTTVARLREALGASICSILELGPHDGLVHMVASQGAPDIDADAITALRAVLPISRASLIVGDCFDIDLDSRAMHLSPPPPGEEGRFPTRDLLYAQGIGSSIHVAIHVDSRRYAINLNFREQRPDLDDITQRVIRLQRAIRPMLQRKLAEEQLTLLSTALNATGDAVMITEAEPVDPPGPRIVYVNDGFTRMTGWTAQQAIGRTPRLLQAAETDRQEIARIHTALRAWQPVRAELLNQRRDGSLFWVELTIVPLANEAGWFTHWVSVQRDATQRRTREEAERQTAATVKRLADELLTANRIARMGTWRWDLSGKALQWSPEVCRILDVDPETFEMSLSNFVALIHPDDRERVRERIGAPIDTAQRFEIDFRIVIRDGTIRHCRCEGDIELDPDGEVIGTSGFCQDVTERKQAEAILLHTEKLKSIGQLTGGIAHDFNNLLTVIAVNLEIAADMLGPHHPVAELLDPAIKAAASGSELTASLLAYARRQPLSPAPTDINAVLGDLHSLATRSLGERHNLRLDREPELPLCRIDRGKLENAVLNLVLNSRDAMPEGGVIVLRSRLAWVTARQARRIGELHPGPHVVVSVEDTGTGIPAHIQPHVFDPFFTTKASGKGTGLGLSMVVGFVRQSGGQVVLDSREGRGTSISIYLPVVE